MKIGILAVQGAFIEHKYALDSLGVESFEIRQKKDAEIDFDGLILPGGESTVMNKLLRELDIFETLKEKIHSGLPVFGTCAGVILLSKVIANDNFTCFANADIVVERNAYGRQLGSFLVEGKFANNVIEMSFIRAPKITKAGKGVEILGVVSGDIVAVKDKNQLLTTFHPELNTNIVHKYFIEMVVNRR
ncbi:MAG: pyridoxal 5'-phosphate synthase glutaminase subunit PdxT [Firmicutes bacterium]|nr:pyridoxal 5'-phosphate synthase glutaminase subunit PdxT [Bacillota bacterium]MCL2256388.1 pyridoxal 5'-phosphate synthase glutaminase subunit PdxT [Bacillota bacterium]